MNTRESSQTQVTAVPEARESTLTLNRIYERAYLKWQVAGRPAGDCARFWVEAEQELLQRK